MLNETSAKINTKVVGMEEFEDALREIKQQWKHPLVVRRQRDLDLFAYGLFNARTLANADSLKTGPVESIKVSAHVVAYPVDSLLEYARSRFVSAAIKAQTPR